MKKMIFTLFAIATLLSCSNKEKSDPSESNQPNILFIMSDDHTGQAIGAYGLRLSKFSPTPNIDKLASEGALLINAFCTNSICVPSRASIMTGQYSHLNRAKTLNDGLDPGKENVAKSLQASGYETALIGKWHLKNKPAGFNYYNILKGQGDYNNPILFENTADFEMGGKRYQGHSTDIITDISLKWLKEQEKSNKPFLLMCHFKAVHEPFYSDDRFRDLFEDQEIPEPEDLFWAGSPKGKRFEGWPLEILTQRFLTNKDRYPPPNLIIDSDDPVSIRKATYQKFIKDYLRTVAGIDENVGRILRYLDESNLMDNTVVIYTSDQGYFLGEHNLFDKRFMLEESLRMPFIIRYPKEIKPDSKIDDIILNIDFAGLLIDYAGAELLPDMQGRSFRQNLKGKTPLDWRKSMYYHYWTHQPQRPSHFGIRTDRYKLINYYGILNMGENEETSWELYDLRNDPHEYINIYDDPQMEKVVVELKAELSRLREKYGDTKIPAVAN